mgnify:CR=1 FL=1
MGDTALATLTQEAMALPYEEQQELLHSLALSLCNRDELAEKSERIQHRLEMLKKYTGCMGGLWANDDPVAYQRRLREDRTIG